MSGHIMRRNSGPHKRAPSLSKKIENGNFSEPPSKASSPPPQEFDGGERTVKKLRLLKALTISEGTTVFDACRRMAARRVDAVLLTDSNALLSGIMTDKDIATRVIAEGLRPEQTMVSKVMTRSPIFVTSDSLALEALQKMVQGKFRHLPVVENGEVIAILDITRCLYDAIVRMEKAAEQSSVIAAAVEGVERHRGSTASASALVETLRERMFKPSLSTLMNENTKVAIVSPADPVYVAAKKMQELRVNSAVIVSLSGTKIQGILTSKDILMRVVAQNISPQLTLVEKVMTPNPDCASVDTTILDALHMMHDGKFLHLPVIDKDGYVVACMDVLQITHAAISMVESSSGAVNDMANTIMQKFWDSALNLEPPEDSDTHSDISGVDTAKSGSQSVGYANSFAFKLEDLSGRVHRFNCGTERLDELVSTVMQRVDVNDGERPTILYEDDEGDKIVLVTDSDLGTAVSCARSAGVKALKLHLDFGSLTKARSPNPCTTTIQKSSVISITQTMIPYGGMLKGSFECQQLQVSSIIRDVNYSCGSCGYELNLNSSNRNTGLIDSKSIKRGIISFFSVDESRFTQIQQLPWSFWIPFFNSKRQQRTKLLCRNCASHLGYAYTLPSQSQSWDGISDDSRIYDIKLTALLPSFCEESSQRLPPHKVWNEISKMLIIGESVPNGFNVSIDRNFSLNSPFPPRNHMNFTLHFTFDLFIFFLYPILITIPYFFLAPHSGFAGS